MSGIECTTRWHKLNGAVDNLRNVMSSRGTISRIGPMAILWNSIGPSASRVTPVLNMGWGMNREKRWVEVLGRTSQYKTVHSPMMCTCSLEKQLYPGLSKKQHSQKVEGDDSPPTLLLWDPTCNSASRSGASSTRRIWTYSSASRRGLWGWSEGWNTSLMKTGWENWGSSDWRREDYRDFQTAFQFPKRI